MVSIDNKEDYASFLKDIAEDALKDSLVSSVASDLISSYIDDAFEYVETVNGNFYIDFDDSDYLDCVNYDFNITMKEEEVVVSETEDSTGSFLKSLSFAGETYSECSDDVIPDMSYGGSLLNHDVWKEIEL
jgi:hypothetical protein